MIDTALKVFSFWNMPALSSFSNLEPNVSQLWNKIYMQQLSESWMTDIEKNFFLAISIFVIQCIKKKLQKEVTKEFFLIKICFSHNLGSRLAKSFQDVQTKVVWQKTKAVAKLLPKKAGNKSSKSFQVFVSITLSAATAPEFDTILEDHWKECRRQIALTRIGIFSSSKLAVNFEPTKNHPFHLSLSFGMVARKAPLLVVTLLTPSRFLYQFASKIVWHN